MVGDGALSSVNRRLNLMRKKRERNRIGRELHDAIIKRLALGKKLGLETPNKAFPSRLPKSLASFVK